MSKERGTESTSRPLAAVLLRRLLLGCLLLAISVAAFQLWREYRDLRQTTLENLQSLADTFAPGAASAIWEYQANLLDSMVEGIGSHPMVVAVYISDQRGKLGARWQAADGSPPSQDLRIERPLYRALPDGSQQYLGRLEIASSEVRIWSRLRGTLLTIGLNGTFFLIFVALMLWLLLRQLVIRPLVSFAHQMESLGSEAHRRTIDLGPSDIAELSTLQSAMNRLLTQLADSHERIAEQNAELELRVAERTREVEEKEKRFRSIFEQASAGIVFADDKGWVLQCNQGFARLLGYENTALEGRNIYDLTHPDDFAEQDLYTQQMMTGGVSDYRREKRYLTRTGDCLWVDLSVSAIRNDKGQLINFVGLAVDISERKKTEAALQLAMQAAEQANRAKSEFLANMSHEIRTPMNAIIGMTQLVLETELTPRQRDFLGKAHVSAQALLGILNDILDFSKIEAGRLDVEALPMRIETVLHGVADLFGARLAEKDVRLLLDIDAAVPELVLGDPLRLAQVLNNLVGNAVKFTEEGEITVKVEVAGRAQDSVCLGFMVRDSGIGIAGDKLGQLFTAFAQGDGSITRRYGGTGLGLAICQKLVRLMGGDIFVSSEVDRGTTFSFTIQAGVCHASAVVGRGAESPRIRGQSGRTSFDGVHVLLAEDNLINQQVASEFLRKRGLQVTVAEHGRAALELAGQQHFDLVLMDLHMPEMDGFEAAKRIHELPGCADLPVIAMTAAVLAEDRERANAAGMVDFVAKPIDTAELTRVLQRWVSHLQIAGETASDLPPSGELPDELPGFDLAGALSRLDRDRQLLRLLLLDFAQEQADFGSVLAAALAVRDGERAAFMLHSLKGAAANLGAVDLYAASEKLEEAVLASQWEAVPGAQTAFLQVLEATLNTLRERLPARKSTPLPATISPVAMSALFGDLIPYLQRREVPPDNILVALHDLRDGLPQDRHLFRLLRQIDEFDHDGALASIQQLAAQHALELQL